MTTKSPPRGRSLSSLEIAQFIAAVNAAALPRLAELAAAWFPGGRREGPEYLALNPHRADKTLGSFKINTRTGRWCDFASGEKGGDPVSLYAWCHGLKQLAAARRLGEDLGVQP